MREDVKLLYEVQKLDEELLALREQIRLYTPQLKELETRLERRKKEIAEVEEKEKSLKKKHYDLEFEMKVKEEQISNLLSRQSWVKTNEQYQALTKEIDNLKKEISNIEDQILEIYNGEESIKIEIVRARKAFEEENKEIKEEYERIERRIAEKREKLIQTKKDRPRLLEKIPPDLLKIYEKKEKKFPANVIVLVKNQSCGGCHLQLLPQSLINLHKEQKISTCRGCGRIFAEDVDYKTETSENNQ